MPPSTYQNPWMIRSWSSSPAPLARCGRDANRHSPVSFVVHTSKAQSASERASLAMMASLSASGSSALTDWMDAGNSHVSRVGVSLLANLGLEELIADSPAGYVALALDLARDRARLGDLRGGLRARMESAPLTDGPGFTRALESAYREMWRTWCDGSVRG